MNILSVADSMFHAMCILLQFLKNVTLLAFIYMCMFGESIKNSDCKEERPLLGPGVYCGIPLFP